MQASTVRPVYRNRGVGTAVASGAPAASWNWQISQWGQGPVPHRAAARPSSAQGWPSQCTTE
ncbi:hypothetical protein GCM10022630_39650 [Thermobifida alba]